MSHIFGVDPTGVGQNIDLKKLQQIGASIITSDKKFPIHVVVDDIAMGTSGTGQIFPTPVGDVTNPDENYTISSINKSNTKAGTTCTAGTGLLLYTVTGGGRVFYLTAINVSVTSGAAIFDIRDSTTVAGTPILAWSDASNPSHTLVFPSPIRFGTGVFLDIVSTGTVVWWLTGIEK